MFFLNCPTLYKWFLETLKNGQVKVFEFFSPSCGNTGWGKASALCFLQCNALTLMIDWEERHATCKKPNCSRLIEVLLLLTGLRVVKKQSHRWHPGLVSLVCELTRLPIFRKQLPSTKLSLRILNLLEIFRSSSKWSETMYACHILTIFIRCNLVPLNLMLEMSSWACFLLSFTFLLHCE